MILFMFLLLFNRGLQFLHTFNVRPLIHGDIKPANILLDSCSQPKIGDFGLAREGSVENDKMVSRVYGTKPYLPWEFLSYRQLSTKVDTFSFGIVLLELATGLPAYNRKTDTYLSRYVHSQIGNESKTLLFIVFFFFKN